MSKLNKHIKFLHIFWHPDLKFLPNLVKTINEESEYFNSEDHLFLTPFPKVYNALKEYDNVILAGNEKDNLISKFGKNCDWIIVHALNCGKIKLLLTPKKYAQKVVWRTWGHDLKEFPRFNNPIKKLLAKIYKHLYTRKVRQFHAIGISNLIDEVSAKHILGEDVRTIKLNYGYAQGKYETACRIKASIVPHSTFRILIGHSGSKTDRHIEVLNSLKHLCDQDIKVCLILSYGATKDYYDYVEDYARGIFKDKVEVIREYMEVSKFVSYLAGMDLICFNQVHSAGLGNLTYSLFFRKRTAFNANSPFVETFEREGCHYYTINSLQNLSLSKIKAMEIDEKMCEIFGQISPKEVACKALKGSFDFLSQVKGNDK